MLIRRPSLSCGLLLAVLGAGNCLAANHAFEVGGIVVTRGKRLTGGGHSARYAISVSNCQWYLRLLPERSTNTPYDYFLYTCDGSNCYSVISQESTAQRDFSLYTDGYAQRTPGLEPRLRDRDLYVLWYGYASHCYLSSITNSLIHPLEPCSYDAYRRQAHRVPARYNLDEAPPHLPKYIALGEKAGEFADVNAGIKDKRNVKSGMEFVVQSYTNLGGLAIPVHITAKYYLSLFPEQPWVTVEAIADKVRLAAGVGKYVPALTQRSLVTDTRYWLSNPPSGVPVIASNWISTEHMDAIYSLRARRKVRPPGFIATRAVLLTLIATGPVCFAIVYSINKRNRKDNK